MTDNLKGISSSQTQSQSQSIKVQKEGVIYSPFTVEDSIIQAAGHNVTRLNQGKEAYPVIVKDDNAKKQFENIRHQLAVKYKKDAAILQEPIDKFKKILAGLPKEGSSPQETLKINELKLKLNNRIEHYTKIMEDSLSFRLSKGIESLQVFSNEESHVLETLSAGQHKLYITGHGFHGYDSIAPTIDGSSKEHKSAETLAKELKQGGLRTGFNDVRTLSCESADARKVNSFDQKELEEARQPVVSKFLKFLRFSSDITTQLPFAQSLSNSFGNLGYKDMQVTGYHGSGQAVPGEQHHFQIIGEEASLLTARSSTVKHVFTPNV
ncbi:hypothetical protein [Shewanella surugensis]|uniref:Uncharacterized protein n=1 Tax=Shewanella surugensis TaxID=212020 RepID=A0ABT0LDS7_9GAMM|nr:hypothetical protein [Shewanella surugensis]MCL1125655.1 hypothetical protein [Shewanella surugensis]